MYDIILIYYFIGGYNMRNKQKGAGCSVSGCGNWCRVRGLCSKHYMALMRYGDVRGGKVGRVGLCRVCGNEFRVIKSNQGYCDIVCYKKSVEGRAAAYAAAKAYRARNKEKSRARGIFRRHPFKKEDSCLVCNTKEKLHRHHHNYKNKMDITVLCKDHHGELHSWDNV